MIGAHPEQISVARRQPYGAETRGRDGGQGRPIPIGAVQLALHRVAARPCDSRPRQIRRGARDGGDA